MSIDASVWGPIAVGVLGVVSTLATGWMGTRLTNARRQLLKEKAQHENEKAQHQKELELAKQATAKAEAEKQERVLEAQAKAQERVLAAEQDIRSMSDNTALLARLIDLLSKQGERTSDDQKRNREALMQMLEASQTQTETLKSLTIEMGSVKTDLGENTHALRLLEQMVSTLPNHLDARTDPIATAINEMIKRFDGVIGGLENAKQQLIVDLTAAIRDAIAQPPPQSIRTLPTFSEGTS
jgi:ATP-dependent 26S proteasome regulatory subunit